MKNYPTKKHKNAKTMKSNAFEYRPYRDPVKQHKLPGGKITKYLPDLMSYVTDLEAHESAKYAAWKVSRQNFWIAMVYQTYTDANNNVLYYILFDSSQYFAAPLIRVTTVAGNVSFYPSSSGYQWDLIAEQNDLENILIVPSTTVGVVSYIKANQYDYYFKGIDESAFPTTLNALRDMILAGVEELRPLKYLYPALPITTVQKTIDPNPNLAVDPETGAPYDPDTGQFVTPDPNDENLVLYYPNVIGGENNISIIPSVIDNPYIPTMGFVQSVGYKSIQFESLFVHIPNFTNVHEQATAQLWTERPDLSGRVLILRTFEIGLSTFLNYVGGGGVQSPLDGYANYLNFVQCLVVYETNGDVEYREEQYPPLTESELNEVQQWCWTNGWKFGVGWNFLVSDDSQGFNNILNSIAQNGIEINDIVWLYPYTCDSSQLYYLATGLLKGW